MVNSKEHRSTSAFCSCFCTPITRANRSWYKLWHHSVFHRILEPVGLEYSFLLNNMFLPSLTNLSYLSCVTFCVVVKVRSGKILGLETAAGTSTTRRTPHDGWENGCFAGEWKRTISLSALLINASVLLACTCVCSIYLIHSYRVFHKWNAFPALCWPNTYIRLWLWGLVASRSLPKRLMSSIYPLFLW